MQIKYKDYIIDVKKGTKVCELLEKQIEMAELKPMACRFNNEIKRLDMEIEEDGVLDLLDYNSKDGKRAYIRGLIFIVCMAIKELYPNAKLTIEYQLYHSMFCLIDGISVTEKTLKEIRKKVDEIIKQNLPITKITVSKEEVLKKHKKYIEMMKHYESTEDVIGIMQFDSPSRDIITLYNCKNYYNYLYGVMPLSTGDITNYELVKYDNGFLIRYPKRKRPEIIPELKDTSKLYETLKETSETHRILNIHSLQQLNTKIKDGKIKDYILLDEALHEKKIAYIADEIAKNPKIRLIAIAGPSSSGKTTFSKRLGIELRLNKIKPVTISVDNYFVEREDTPLDEDGNLDFESINAIDTKLLNDHIEKLLKGEEIEAPTFNFHTGHKEYLGNKMKLNKDEILVMEGIHCLNDKLTYLIPKNEKFKIYISALTVLNIDNYNRISTTDTRLIRRIVRDKQYRGYSAETTLSMWPGVNKGEGKNIYPFQEEADAMFNSALVYELSALKNYALPQLQEISNKSPYYSEAKRLCTLLSYFEAIDSKDIPSNSLLREFIGGSIFE